MSPSHPYLKRFIYWGEYFNLELKLLFFLDSKHPKQIQILVQLPNINSQNSSWHGGAPVQIYAT